MQFFASAQSFYWSNIEHAVETESHEEQLKIVYKILDCTPKYPNIFNLKSDVKN